MKRYEIAIWIATGYLLLYVLLFEAGAGIWALSLLFTLSPVPVFYMVYQILKNAGYAGKDLGAGEEFGYQDVDKNTIGMF